MIWIINTIILFFFSWRYYWLILRCGIGVNFSREVCTSGITTRFRSCGNDVTLRRFFVLHDMIPFQRFTFRAGSLIATGRFIGTQNISIDDNKKIFPDLTRRFLIWIDLTVEPVDESVCSGCASIDRSRFEVCHRTRTNVLGSRT